MPHRLARLAPLVVPLGIVLAACGGGSASPGTSSAPAASPSAAASPSDASGASGSPAASADASGSPAADVTVTAVDFKYEGLPAEVASGTTLALVNTGQEVHEIAVVRKLPTTTQTFEELLAMPEDQAQALVQNVGFAYAEPGKTAADIVTIGEPGEYLALCFIPAGTTSVPSIDPNSPEAPSLGTGAPHFTLGMMQEFTVTGS